VLTAAVTGNFFGHSEKVNGTKLTKVCEGKVTYLRYLRPKRFWSSGIRRSYRRLPLLDLKSGVFRPRKQRLFRLNWWHFQKLAENHHQVEFSPRSIKFAKL